MPARPEAPPATARVANRCRCGHFPTQHMRVTPAPGPGNGAFRLEPSGPCAVCGEASCRRFTPTL